MPMNSMPVHIEITQTTLKVLRENAGLELPLERAANGRLTAACKNAVALSLQSFLGLKPWQPRPSAFCAINANGVSLRRLTLPPATGDDLLRLLRLQIESEFPLSPDELAWGWQSLGSSSAARQDVLVAAVRLEVVADYAEVLMAGGVKPVFTLAALARATLCSTASGSCAMLDLDGSQTELVTFEDGAPVSVRVLSSAAVADSAAKALGSTCTRLIITGASSDLASQISHKLGGGVAVETLVTESGTGRSAAIHGLKKSAAQNGGSLPLVLQVKAKRASGSFALSAPDVKLWAVHSAVLLCVLLMLPYVEALFSKPFLKRKLSALSAETNRLVTIDRELEFLQALKQNQPPYLDAIYLFSKLAPQGSKIESLTMNRRGEVSLRGSMRDATQVTDFRTKLIGSGFFATIAVEEQSPGQGKLTVRMSAQWKPFEARAGLTNGPTLAEIEKAKSGGKDVKGGGAMPSMPSMSPGMMPGMPPGIPTRTMPPGGLPAGFKLPPGVNPADLPPEVLKQLQGGQ